MKGQCEIERFKFLVSWQPKRYFERHFFLMSLNNLGLDSNFEIVTNLFKITVEENRWVNTNNYLWSGNTKVNGIPLLFSIGLCVLNNEWTVLKTVNYILVWVCVWERKREKGANSSLFNASLSILLIIQRK